MSHPQPPFGSQDPNQQPQEPPTQPFPTAPMPPVPNNPYAPPPSSGAPYPAQPPNDPFAPLPPTSGAPYPPPQPGAYPPPPTSGAPYPPPGQYPSAPGEGYPPPGQYPSAPSEAYPPAGGPYPPAPGQPFGGPVPVKKSNKGLWIGLGVGALVLLLLCCGGGIFALYSGAKKTQDAIENLPTPGITSGPFDDTPAPSASQPSPDAGKTDGETFNMKPGDTLIINDDDGTIKITLSNFRTKTSSCQEFMPGPKKGMYLIADVTAEVTKGTGSINPFYFRWKGADGSDESGISGAFSGCGKLLSAGNNLPSGTKRTGQLVLDVKDKNGVIEYQHKFRPAGSWKP
ncbi:hypothetical protein [Micromonospora sp. HK10]|uniref:hypothetical protein n=1 Tax=Micromonospora sp. HK10 TaxID=1538294 RepID=UPI0006271872|nr:hypothetical protein [Micromonospora sp. HK10]KKJ94776.1 hypothetical protein LQ51_27455 [Micromonospora sp. HK10]